MPQYSLSARVRKNKGKEHAKKLRGDDHIPAIFYGPDTTPIMLAVGYSDLEKIIKKTAGENIILELQINSDAGNDTRMVLLKELQTDPIKETFLHADFYEISMDKEITIDIPILLVNTPAGVTQGGVLQHIRREITISVLPANLIEYLEVDVSGLEIGESIHIRDIDFPDGIKKVQEDHLTVAVVATPTVTEKDEEAEEVGEAEETEELEEKETKTTTSTESER